MKRFIRFTLGLLVFGPFAFSAQAEFTSLYVFGDGVCATTNGPAVTNFYGKRWTNGRVWVELLAQRLGLTNNYWYSTNSAYPVAYTNLSSSSTNWSYSSNNWSYFGDDSTNMLKHVTNSSPPDASTALFVIWCIDADFVWNANNSGTNIATWTNAVNQALTNHFKAITNLYAKGARTLIMPNAVDITKVPYYVYYAASNKAFIRQRAIDFNAAFATMLSNAMASLQGLVIYEPDLFTLLDTVLAQPAVYGLTNTLDANGQSVDALADTSLTNKALNGPGTNYIFWDNLDPSAKLHTVIADMVSQLMSPAQIIGLTQLSGSNRLDATNIPIGRDGYVEGSTNLVLVSWTFVQNVSSTNVTESIFVPAASGLLQFYRLRFPFSWSWP